MLKRLAPLLALSAFLPGCSPEGTGDADVQWSVGLTGSCSQASLGYVTAWLETRDGILVARQDAPCDAYSVRFRDVPVGAYRVRLAGFDEEEVEAYGATFSDLGIQEGLEPSSYLVRLAPRPGSIDLAWFFRGGRFYVLAVDQKKVRLFRGNRFGIGEIEPKGIPAGIAETLKHEAAERHYKFRTPIEAVSGAGRRAAPFHGHGQGPGPDDAKEKIRRYLHQVDAGLRQTLNGDRAPLVLAGVGYELDLYREVSSFPALVEEGIEGNPQGLSGEELRKRAWAIVEPRFRKAEEDAANRYREGTARGRTSEDLTEIIAAARAGRTELLFTALDHQVWGTYDRDSGAIQIHDGHLPGDEDLLDLAALLTLATNGAVHAVPAERLPGASPACVLLRY